MRGNVFGAGSGISKYEFDFNNDGDTVDEDVEIVINPETDATAKYNENDYSTSAGSVTRFTMVNINGGTIHRNVYGGGSMGSVGAPRITQDYDPYIKDDATEGHGAGKQSFCLVNIKGTVGTPTDYNPAYGGNVFGACRGDKEIIKTSEDESIFATSVWTKVMILNGAHIMGNVFGGGDAGAVKKDSEVIVGE